MNVDIAVVGTGLQESILAAALSKAGFTVAHLDHNAYYGGDDASLALDELRQWAEERQGTTPDGALYLTSQSTRYTSISTQSSSSATATPKPRQFAISLSPTIVPSIGPLVDSLIASGASRYGGFKLLERVALFHKPGYVKTVPGSKEDVFKSAELNLLDKRRLMRFLMFASSEFEGKTELVGKEDAPFLGFLRQTFSLNAATAEAVAYALAFCSTAEDPTLPALQRIRRYLRSAGRYGASPFLVGHYGGAGEVAQGFCRLSAVNGGIYILGREVTSIANASKSEASESTSEGDSAQSKRFSVTLRDFEETVNCDVLVSSNDYLGPELQARAHTATTSGASPSQSIARCIAIIDRPIVFRSDQPSSAPQPMSQTDEELEEKQEAEASEVDDGSRQVDTALLIFPPSIIPGGSSTIAVNVLVSGEQAMATPRGYWVLHLSMPLAGPSSQTAEELLKPYLDATLTLAASGDAEAAVVEPIHSLFYIQHASPPSQSSPEIQASSDPIFLPAQNSALLAESADSAATNAETVFWKVVDTLKEVKGNKKAPTDEKVEEAGEKETKEKVIDSFWPPISDTSVVEQDW